MLKEYKNALLEAISKSGLDPSWFQSTEVKPPFWERLRAKSIGVSTPPVFIIEVANSPVRFYIKHSIANFDLFHYKSTGFSPTLSKKKWSEEPKFIEDILKIFDTWLKREAKSYIEEKQLPDLWAQLDIYKSFITNSTIPVENAPKFTEEEKENLRRSVHEFRRQVIENFQPSPDQMESINSQLDYLASAVDRLNRFDWRGLAISTLIGIALNLSVDTERGRLLFRLFQQAFQAAGNLLQ